MADRVRFRPPQLGVLAVALVAELAGSPPVAAAEAEYPEVAGETTIIAYGTAGVTLAVQHDVRLLPGPPQCSSCPGDALEIEVEGDQLAYAVVAPHTCSQTDSDPDWFCVNTRTWVFPEEVPNSPSTFVYDRRVRAGLVDVYVVAGGPVRLTLRFEDLEGRTEVAATDAIDAQLETLPRGCPNPDLDPGCAQQGWGGASHSLGDDGRGLVSAVVTSKLPRGLVPGVPPFDELNAPGSRTNDLCVYPTARRPEASPDPEAHPHGCDVTPTEDGSTEWLEHHVNYWGNASTLLGGSTTLVVTSRRSGVLGPDVYVGYMAHQVSAHHPVFGGGEYGAHAVWLARGVN